MGEVEVEVDAEINTDEYEEKRSTWVRVSTALSPNNSPFLRSTAALPLSPPTSAHLPITCADLRRLQRGRQRLHGRGKHSK